MRTTSAATHERQDDRRRSVDVDGARHHEPLDFQVVGVGARQIGIDADEHDRRAGGDEPARDELLADQRAGRVHVLADVGADRHDAPVERQPPRGVVASVVARIGARGRSADSRRAVLPPRVTATIACASPRSASVTAASQSACA